jgi:hypothetical protein
MQPMVIVLLVCLLAVPLASLAGTMVARSSLLVADVERVELAPVDQRRDRAEDAARGSVDLCGDTDAPWLAGANQVLDRTLGVAMKPLATSHAYLVHFREAGMSVSRSKIPAV